MTAFPSVVPAAAIVAMPIGEPNAKAGKDGQQHGNEASRIHSTAPFLRATRHV